MEEKYNLLMNNYITLFDQFLTQSVKLDAAMKKIAETDKEENNGESKSASD